MTPSDTHSPATAKVNAAEPREREARAREVLHALANLIERPPLDDVVLKQDVALRAARAIRVILGERSGEVDAAGEGSSSEGWRQINSAPKDGSRVLLWLGAPWSKVECARWYAPWGNWQVGVLPADPAREEMHGVGSAVPTHWRPLPPAPVADGAAGAPSLVEAADWLETNGFKDAASALTRHVRAALSAHREPAKGGE